MKKCPICQAPYSGKRHCHRCGADLESLIRIREEAGALVRSARSYFEKGAYEPMYDHAKKAVSKCSTPESLKILALASLLTLRFKLALSLWKELKL